MKRLVVLAIVTAALAVLTVGCPGQASCKAYSANGFSGQSCGGRGQDGI